MRHQNVLWNLALREIRVRYKQSVLGVVWALFVPLAMMLTFAFVFSRLTGVADTFATSLTQNYDDPEAFFEFFSGVVVSRLGEGPAFRRFLASLTLADPEVLLSWGKSCVAATGDTKSGEEYAALDVDTLYIWGNESTPEMTRDFILENDINNKEIKGTSHWVMIDKSGECYGAIHDFFTERD